MNNEVYAAIAMALHEFQSHVLTMTPIPGK